MHSRMVRKNTTKNGRIAKMGRFPLFLNVDLSAQERRKEMCVNQDTFDHNRGQTSATPGRRLHWIFLNFLQSIFQGEIFNPPPHFWPEGIFQGRGVYILKPHAAGILYAPPPPFIHPPTPRRVFSGAGGWGCIKFGPADLFFSPSLLSV